ncbi:MAG: glycosyltransferase family 4 protein [Pseudomonadota bacterium]
MTIDRKLIYILNGYSEGDASHFSHIIHLLDVMAEAGCEIRLVIEKPIGALPVFSSSRISAVGLTARGRVLRQFQLFLLISRLIREGYTKTFVRIAAPAAIIAALAHRLFGGDSYLWQSGTTYEHDWSQPRSLRKMRWWLTSFLPNWMARRLVTYFVTGPESMVDYYHRVVGIPIGKIRLLYNDIDLQRFGSARSEEDRKRLLQQHEIPADATVLLLVHRLSPVRRTLMYLAPFFDTIKACTDIGPWVLIVAGGGSELAAAKALARERGVADKVRFLGDVPNKKIADLYAVADVFVHPTYTEGFPRVLIEAMASGLPIVSTDAGGARELVGHRQSGFLTSKSDPQAFARVAADLIRDRAEWPLLSTENRQHVERFSTPNVAAMYLRSIFS